MSLSLQSVEILLDLIEIKIGYMQVQDRDDAKELLKLRYCRQELLQVLEDQKAQRKGSGMRLGAKKSASVKSAAQK